MFSIELQHPGFIFGMEGFQMCGPLFQYAGDFCLLRRHPMDAYHTQGPVRDIDLDQVTLFDAGDGAAFRGFRRNMADGRSLGGRRNVHLSKVRWMHPIPHQKR